MARQFPLNGGVRFGRPPKFNSRQRQEARQRLAAGETQADIARTFGVDATTIGRLQLDTGRPLGLEGGSVAP
jgi:DNA invertase Pin-like site-specific DNA recombinase